MDGYDVSVLLSYEPNETFDVVTMTFGMDYFDIDEFFRKVSGLMSVGGVFATVNDYCYECFACAMHLPMDAPWLHVRVTKDDLPRYYDEFRPDIADVARKAIYFPSLHITIKDYMRTAKENGVELCFYRRIINTDYVRDLLFTNPLIRDYFRDMVLPVSRVINRSVIADDFFTRHLAVVFRKVRLDRQWHLGRKYEGKAEIFVFHSSIEQPPIREHALDALPALEQVVLDAELVEGAAHGLVDDVHDRFGAMVEGRHRRQDGGAEVGGLDHELQVALVERRFAGNQHQFALFLQGHVGGTDEEVLRKRIGDAGQGLH